MLATILLSLVLIAAPTRDAMAVSACATPHSHAEMPNVADCLFILRAAVGAATCVPACTCRVAEGGKLSSKGALLCLRSVVGQPVSTNCDCGSTTTTSTLPGKMGECEFSGTACHSKFDCEEECFGSCAAPRDICVRKSLAIYRTCYAGCAEDDLVCQRRCVLRQHTDQRSCEQDYEDCASPCDDELCDGLGQGPRFEDTGLTIIDHQAMLEWEKKTIENSDARYTWSSGPSITAHDGTVFTEFLRELNDPDREGGCYAGHCDWRLPTSSGERTTGRHGEMESIHKVVYCPGQHGCVDPLFGPVSGGYYGSSTPDMRSNSAVWTLNFGDTYPRIRTGEKFHARPVRAVRHLR